MTDYNPFGKKVSELEKEDLDNLIDKVAEGWYVEYKGDFPNNKKISHSIASFANTDGGWYIIGVEGDNGTNLAKNITPFDLTEHSEPKDKIRNVIVNRINPIPFFESKLINISDDEGVLVVYIKRGDETPYVTNDGRIYQRNGEGSDPVEINDHYTLQKLFDRSKESKFKIEKFSRNPFSMSKAQGELNECFLEVYSYISPSDKFKFDEFYSEEFFKEVIENFSTPVEFIHETITMHADYNNIFSSKNSYILRITNPENSIDLSTTIELFGNGNLKFIFPVPMLPLDGEWGDTIEQFDYTDNYEKFYDLLSDREVEFLKVINAHSFMIHFAIIFNQYVRLLKNHNFKEQLGLRFRISKCWRNLLFFNDAKYINFIEEYGVPTCLKSNIEIPEFIDGNLINVDTNDINEPIGLMSHIYGALGLPYHLNREMTKGLTSFLVSQRKDPP